MKLLRNHAMQDDLIRCMSLVGLGVYFTAVSGVSRWQKNLAKVGLLLLLVMSLLQIWQLWRDKHMTPEEQREAKREANDERSRMIQDRAMRNCWGIEDALLIIGLIVFVVRNQPAVYSVLYALLAARELACIVMRWWLERKY